MYLLLSEWWVWKCVFPFRVDSKQELKSSSAHSLCSVKLNNHIWVVKLYNIINKKRPWNTSICYLLKGIMSHEKNVLSESAIQVYPVFMIIVKELSFSCSGVIHGISHPKSHRLCLAQVKQQNNCRYTDKIKLKLFMKKVNSIFSIQVMHHSSNLAEHTSKSRPWHSSPKITLHLLPGL